MSDSHIMNLKALSDCDDFSTFYNLLKFEDQDEVEQMYPNLMKTFKPTIGYNEEMF